MEQFSKRITILDNRKYASVEEVKYYYNSPLFKAGSLRLPHYIEPDKILEGYYELTLNGLMPLNIVICSDGILIWE